MPKFGNHLAADVWAVAARTLTDISAEEIFDLPDIDSIYPGVAAISSSTADTFGSWVEISADVGTGKRLLFAAIKVSAGIAEGDTGELEFGEGASGSEARVAGRTVMGDAWIETLILPIHLALTDNARLSVRVRDGEFAANTSEIAAWVA